MCKDYCSSRLEGRERIVAEGAAGVLRTLNRGSILLESTAWFSMGDVGRVVCG